VAVVTVQIGIDLGQKIDPTGICVAELERRGADVHYVIRHLERILGMSYPDQVERIVEIYRGVGQKGHQAKLFLDATGLGAPILDELRKRRLPLVGVFLTGSERAVWEADNTILRLGKSQMVSRLQVLLAYNRVHLPQTDEAKATVDELLNYEIRVNDLAHAQFGAFKVGKHDDLATALGLAVWHEPKPKHVHGSVAMIGVKRQDRERRHPWERGRVRDKFAERGGTSQAGGRDEQLG